MKKNNQFDVAPGLQRFYQAEALIPSPIPPDLIEFPSKPIKLSVKKKKTNVVLTKVSEQAEVTCEEECLSVGKTKCVQICDKFSEPESVEAKIAGSCLQHLVSLLS